MLLSVSTNRINGVEMIEALWSTEFRDGNNQMFGSGIVVFENGKVLGGDSGFTFVGDYSIKYGVGYASIRVKRYSNTINMQSISGLDDYVLDAVGKIDRNHMVFTGTSKSAPGFTINIDMVRRAELP